MSRIRVAIAGVGNCASALVQGVEKYRRGYETNVGISFERIGGYSIEDIEFTAAFDVGTNKIGKDISEAIFANPNCCKKFVDVPKLGVKVLPAPKKDGVSPHMEGYFKCYRDGEVKPVEVSDVLKETNSDILINFLPVGSYEGTRFYASKALEAGVAFINAIPEFVASDTLWAKKFEEKGLPIAGDDIKSQLGSTILHRMVVELMRKRGLSVDETYQLNVGGNADFFNMTKEERLATKRISKTEAVTSLLPYEVPTKIGPSDYVPFLKDTKVAYIYVKGRNFGGLPVKVEIKLEVQDSPNSAGVMVDVIRAVRVARDRGIAGQLISISAWAFKHPPVQVDDDIAYLWFKEFIEGKRNK